MSSQATPIFVIVEHSKVLPSKCLVREDGAPLSDIELAQLLINVIQQIDEDRIQMLGDIKKMEDHLLEKYGEIYQETE